jgi:hypothetical protein
MNFPRLSPQDLYQQELRILQEANDCHNPAGPGGGQFCSKGGGDAFHGGRAGKTGVTGMRARQAPQPGENLWSRKADRLADKAAAQGKHERAAQYRKAATFSRAKQAEGDNIWTQQSPGFRQGINDLVKRKEAEVRSGMGGPIAGPGAPKKVTHKMEPPPAESLSTQYGTPFGVYRGMTIRTLSGYMTPYYFADAPGFGSFHHTPSLTRLKRQINVFKDTGATAQRQEKEKASARYQKRKARYGR